MRSNLPLALALAFAFALALTFAACGTGSPTTSPDLAFAPADLAGTGMTSATLQMTSFTIPAGMEVFKCQDFKNPFAAEAYVKKYESVMTAGSHHLIVFLKDNAVDGPLEDCTGLEFGPSPYGSQQPTDSITFPDGVAALAPAASGYRVQVHYLNATAKPIDVAVHVTMYDVAASTVSQHAGQYFFNNISVNIPATGQPYTITKTCTLAAAANILSAVNHMHRWATHFTATAAGQTFYESDVWSEPKRKVFDPPLQLAAGTKVTFTCTYVNDTGAPITFGESAQANEMCILAGSFYPSPTPTVSCF